MASITKHSSGYRAQIKLTLRSDVPPHRESRTFPTKREAQLWAAQRETELRENTAADPSLQYTLRDALRKYADEVSPTTRGERWEQVRLSAFESYKLPLDASMLHITAQDIADFRDRLLRVMGYQRTGRVTSTGQAVAIRMWAACCC